jgi:sialate O-acetylesterase
MFGSHMVLQRDRANNFWGWAPTDQKITVKIANHTWSTTAKDGRWDVKFNPPPVGGPYTVEIDGPSHVELDDVLVGDVWICSGQSNMEFGVGNLANPKEEISAADHPTMRLFVVKDTASVAPLTTVTGTWNVCSPDTITQGMWNGFSAVGYFFGRELNEKLKIPIGLIQTSWGGTPAEAWTSEQSLRPLNDFDKTLDLIDAQATAKAPVDDKLIHNQNAPSELYNGMIAPVAPIAIKGAIWYQGESNVGRAAQYQRLLPTMIDDWRKTWREGNFPFMIVQIANFSTRHPDPVDDPWADLRESQALTVQREKNTGLAVTIDIGEEKDIHPKNKVDVGRRLALAALHVAYKENVVYSGPVYRSEKQDNGQLVISFNHTEGGLKATDLTDNFQIAGDDHKYYWADAKIVGNTVVLSSPSVPHPTDARYAWDANPLAGLYNGANLPAVPFRTEPPPH